MYQSKIDPVNARLARLQVYEIDDPDKPVYHQLSDVLSEVAPETAAIYVDQYTKIVGLMLNSDARERFIKEVTRHLLVKYRPPYNETWIRRCEDIAELVYTSRTDPAAHLGALSVSQQFELRTVFHSAESLEEGMSLVTELSRLYTLDAEIMLTKNQQCRDAEHNKWVAKQTDMFRAAVSDVVKRAAEQSAVSNRKADQASNLIRDLLALADEVSLASSESANAMGAAASTAGNLRVTLDDMTCELSRASQSLGAATQVAEETQNTVDDLTSQTASIQSIAQMIQSITSQTSILALNARIEAARAGDAGRGFSVVASEIKGLSEQTAKATEDIVSRLGGIEKASDRALNANRTMHETFGTVRDVTQSVCNEVTLQGTTVTKIAASVDETSLSAKSSSEAVKRIRELVDGIAKEMTAATNLASDLNAQISRLEEGADEFLQSLSLKALPTVLERGPFEPRRGDGEPETGLKSAF